MSHYDPSQSEQGYESDNDSQKDDENWTDWGVDGNGPTGTGPVTRDSRGNIVPDRDDE